MTSPSPSPSFRIEYATRSDLGMRRMTNQDAVVAAPSDSGGPITDDRVLVVADGMGAHAAGELASQIAVDVVPLAYFKDKSPPPSALRQAVREANRRIYAKGESSPEFHGMGTTCSCLVLSPAAALVAHVGDSRVYRLRDGVLKQLTSDHSLVWEMAAASHVTEDKVPSCIPKNVITRSLGPHETVNVDLEGPHDLADGDVFLLCSDGLTGVVEDPLIGALIGAMAPDDAAQTLIDLANLRGGPDNISVVIARIAAGDGASPKPSGRPGSFRKTGVALAGVVAGLIAFGWFYAVNSAAGMLLSAAGCGAATMVAARKQAVPARSGSDRGISGSYGNGPYRSCDCSDPVVAAEALNTLVKELAAVAGEDTVDAASDADVSTPSSTALSLLDWGPFAPAHQEANAAYDAGEHARSIRLYSGLIRGVMNAVQQDDGTRRYRAAASAGK